MINLSYRQARWLDMRGGRTIDDVLVDNIGLYFVVVFKRKIKKIYLSK